jgi:hypothetical protein
LLMASGRQLTAPRPILAATWVNVGECGGELLMRR